MKKIIAFTVALLTLNTVYAQNPVIPHPYTADPSLHQWSDGKFYIYGSHDQDNATGWNMEDYRVQSSDDMVHWKDNGVALRNTQTPWGGAFWAPDAAEKDGKYYIYFPEGDNIGVAESVSPTGPFTNPRSIYKMPQGYQQAYDPAVFSHDGKNYLIISELKGEGGFYPVIFTLKDNMVEIVPGSKVELPSLPNFHEGPFMFYREGKFYLMGGGYTSLRYWMADNLYGPYESKGDFLLGNDTFTISKTAHGSVLHVGDQWYLAYHYDVFPGDSYRRTTCIDSLFFNQDGTIQMVKPSVAGIAPIVNTKPKIRPRTVQAEDFKEGGEGVAYHDNETLNRGGTYRLTEGVDIYGFQGGDIGNYVGSTNDGEWLEYLLYNIPSGTYTFNFRLACTNANGSIAIGLNGKTIGTLHVPNTGGEQKWEMVQLPDVNIIGGISNNLRLTFNGDGINLDDFTIFENQLPVSMHSFPGTIQAEDFDYGGEGKAFHDRDATNLGGEYRPYEGVDITTTSDVGGGFDVDSISNGEWLEYTIGDIVSGTYMMGFRVACEKDNQSITAVLDGDTLGTVVIPKSVGKTEWQMVYLPKVNIPKGSDKVLCLKFKGNGFKLNYITVFAEHQAYKKINIPGIIQAEDFNEGFEGYAYHDNEEKNLGGEYRPFRGVDIETTTDDGGGYHIGGITGGEWLEYSLNNAPMGNYMFGFRVATLNSNCSITLSLEANVLGIINVPNTGGWQNWQTVSFPDVKIPENSNKCLRLTFNGGAFNLNFIKVSAYPYKTLVIPGIIQAEDFNLGGEGVGYHDTSASNQGNSYRTKEGVDIEKASDAGGGYSIGFTDTGEWLDYTLNDIPEGIYSIEFRVATINNGTSIDASIDGKILGKIAIPNTGGWQTWKTITLENVNLSKGTNSVLRLTENGGFNLNYIKFTKLVSGNQTLHTTPDFSISPVPSKNEIKITGIGDNCSYQIFGVAGDKLTEGKLKKSTINIDQLKRGVYILSIKGHSSVKFVKD